jgi:hypothetical protein
MTNNKQQTAVGAVSGSLLTKLKFKIWEHK